MTNYMQILAVSMSFNLHFPEYMTNAFSGASRVGNSSGVLLSFDWLLLDTRFADWFDNIAYLKVACIAILPFLLIGGFAIVLKIYYYKNSQQYKRVVCITFITILFLLHPTLASYWLRIFKCNSIGNGLKRVEMDIQTEWWSAQHKKWIYCLGKHS